MVRKLFTFLFLVLLFCGLMTVAGADWEFYSNAVIYRGTDNNPLTGSWTIDGTSWSFGNDGRLLGNGKVQMPGGQACFPDADGELLTGFRVVDGVTYFFDPYPVPGMQSEYNPQTDRYDYYFFDATTGRMLTGWQDDKDWRYYFSPSDGKRLEDGWQVIEGKRYYLPVFMYSGCASLPSETPGETAVYYLDPETGEMLTGWQADDNGLYYFSPSDGKRLEDWQTIGGKKYYLRPAVAIGITSIQNQQTGGFDTYWFDETGVMQTGWRIDENGKRSYFGPDGVMRTGWQEIDGSRFYLESNGMLAYAVTGEKSFANDAGDDIDFYFFDETGRMQTGWVERPADGYRFFFDGSETPTLVRENVHLEKARFNYGTNGVLRLRWQTIDGKTYFFAQHAIVGFQVIRNTETYLDEYFLFDENGVLQTGFHVIDGIVPLFFGEDGRAVTGWQTVGGKTYYFSPFAQTGWRTIDGKTYFFDESGVLQIGWIKTDDGFWHLTGEDGAVLTSYADMESLTIPEEVDSLSIRDFTGISRSFLIYCEPGSYAEEFAKFYGLQYDNGIDHVVGYKITDLNEKVAWIVAHYTDPGMSDREKALAFHNWIIYNAFYSSADPDTQFEPDGILLKGKGVCSGYARAYSLLLDAVGIENRYLSGTEEMDHAWNVVKINGKWYHVDTTWDDPNNDTPMISGAEGSGNFLKTDAELSVDHSWEDVSVDKGQVGFISDGTYSYYYGSDGKRAVGWKYIPSAVWFIDSSLPEGGYAKVMDMKYYFDENGRQQKGWLSVDGFTYYLDPWAFAGAAWNLNLNDNVTTVCVFDEDGCLVSLPYLPETILLPAQMTRIESESFAGLEDICLRIPATVTFIAEDAFEPSAIVYCPAGSYAAKRCAELGLLVIPQK